jgi:hypothetical protein
VVGLLLWDLLVQGLLVRLHVVDLIVWLLVLDLVVRLQVEVDLLPQVALLANILFSLFFV